MYKEIWVKIIQYLDKAKPQWKKEIEELGQIRNYLRRQKNERFSDEELFEGVVLGILSRGTDYRSIHNNKEIIKQKFNNYSLSDNYLELSHDDVKYLVTRLIGRFNEDNINNAVMSSVVLKKIINIHGSIDSFIIEYYKNDIDRIIKLISSPGDYKIPGVGEVIASEIVKNWGFSSVKADQHILRSYACLGWISIDGFIAEEKDFAFPEWTRDINTEVMQITETLSGLINEPMTYIDNVIWYLCSTYGCHLKNKKIVSLFADNPINTSKLEVKVKTEKSHKAKTYGNNFSKNDRILEPSNIEKIISVNEQYPDIVRLMDRIRDRGIGNIDNLTPPQRILYDVIKNMSENGLALIKHDIQIHAGNRINLENVLPTDFCYNIVNINDNKNKYLIFKDNGSYEFHGFKWPADVINVTWRPKGKPTLVVGTCNKDGYHWKY